MQNNCNMESVINQGNKQERKINALKRAEKKKLDVKKANKKEPHEMDIPIPVVKQIENSELELTSYTEEGSQLVTNVLIANNNRENNRQETDKSERDMRLKAVELESQMANSKFMEINYQWPIILKKNDALEIHEHLELQKKRGFDLIEQKNQIIDILKRDLAESDSKFLHEQAAQSEDVRILQERIENQVKFIRKQYQNHLQFIKSTVDQQREYRIDKANESWKKIYNETVMIEYNSLDERLAMIEKKENNIMKQYEMNEETIRNLKLNVNSELHRMQRELELIKMKCFENVEKLNYNYQVLKRKEEENACAKAAQRRKINKLQDILSTKRKNLRETKSEFTAKVPLLRYEIEKLKNDIDRHRKKAERFSEIQEKTYKELWDFSQEQINSRLERIFKIDQIIHETQLGVDWHPPEKLKYLDVSDLPSYKKKPNTPDAEVIRFQNNHITIDPYTEAREQDLLRLVLDKTIKNVSFVLDNELIEIIKSHPKKHLTLLYNAMAAYGLHNIDSWKFLLSYTQSMVTCTICRGPVLWHKNELNQPEKVESDWKTETENKLVSDLLVFTNNHTKNIEKASSETINMMEKTYSRKFKTIFKQKPVQFDINEVADGQYYQSLERTNTDSDNSTITFSLSLTDFEPLCSENDSNPALRSQHSFSQMELENFHLESEERKDFMDAASSKHSQSTIEESNKDDIILNSLCDNPNHPIMIEDTDYLRVIKKSIDTSKSKALDQRGKHNSNFYLTNMLSTNDIRNYWKQFLYAFPEDRMKLWEIFDKALKKYYQALHMRNKKMKEVEQLEIENMELKKILKQFMDAEQDDVRLQNICTPKVKKQQINSLKQKSKPIIFTDDSTNICGTSINIITVNKHEKKKLKRPFIAPIK